MTPEKFTLAFNRQIARLGLTQPEAATLLKVSPRTIWQWKAGRGNPLPATMDGAISRLKSARKK